MTAAKKFVLMVCVTSLFLAGMIVSFFMLLEANENERDAYKNQYESYLLADEMRQSSDDLTRLVRVFTVTRDERFLDQYKAVLDIRSGKKARPEEYYKIYWDFVAAGKDKPRQDTVKISLIDLMKEAGFSKAELDMLAEVGKRSDALVESEIRAMDIVHKTSPDDYDFQKQIARAQQLTHNLQYHKDKAYIMEAMDKFYTLLEKRVEGQLVQAGKIRTMWKFMAIVSVLILVVMLGAFSVLFISILRQLGEDPGYLYSASREIGGGNLDFVFRGGQPKKGVYGVFCEMVASMKGKIQEAQSRTEEAANESRRAQEATEQARKAQKQAERAKSEGMNAAANDLSEIVERVSSASEELSAQIVETNDGAERQSSMSADAATAMEQMNSTVLEVAKNASAAAENADKAKAEANSGKSVVNELVGAIKEVYAQTESMKAQLSGLGNRAENIGQIMNVISDIADQTNLLALNAAIEAARAGDAGRGFAVVADEVRKLAEKTMDATKDVAQAISDIQHDTKESIQGMDTAGEAVEHSNSLADKAGESLFSILALVEGTADQVRNIATASEEQSAASEEISSAVHNIHSISTQTAEGMDQANAAIAELAKMAAELKSLINEMKQA